MNSVYSNISGVMIGVWVILHAFSSHETIKTFQSFFLFGKWKYNNVNKIYEFIYLKMFDEKDINFITMKKLS